MCGSECPLGMWWTLPQLPLVQPFSPGAAHSTFLDVSGINTSEELVLLELLQALAYVSLATTPMGRLT